MTLNKGDRVSIDFEVTGEVSAYSVTLKPVYRDLSFCESPSQLAFTFLRRHEEFVTVMPAPPKPLPTGIGTLIEGDNQSGNRQITFIRADVDGGRFHWYSPHTNCHYTDDEIVNWKLK